MKAEEWCPLFGALPEIIDWGGIYGTAIKAIIHARGIFRPRNHHFHPTSKHPEPDEVERNTGFPAAWVEDARFLCRDSVAILSAAGWNEQQKGFGTSYTFDVDEVSGKTMTDTIGQRFGIDQDFARGISPPEAFALMAVGEAWRSIRCLDKSEHSSDDGDRDAMDHLMRAEKLLKAALASSLKETRVILEETTTQERLRRSNGTRKSIEIRREKAEVQYQRWQSMAEQVWSKHPGIHMSTKSVAEIIVKGTNENPEYVRRKIKKPAWVTW